MYRQYLRTNCQAWTTVFSCGNRPRWLLDLCSGTAIQRSLENSKQLVWSTFKASYQEVSKKAHGQEVSFADDDSYYDKSSVWNLVHVARKEAGSDVSVSLLSRYRSQGMDCRRVASANL